MAKQIRSTKSVSSPWLGLCLSIPNNMHFLVLDTRSIIYCIFVYCILYIYRLTVPDIIYLQYTVSTFECFVITLILWSYFQILHLRSTCSWYKIKLQFLRCVLTWYWYMVSKNVEPDNHGIWHLSH